MPHLRAVTQLPRRPEADLSLDAVREGGRLPISHLDLYRLEDMEVEDPALIDDYLGGDGVAFVEWPAVGVERLGRPALEVRLEHAGEDRRTIEIVGQSTKPIIG